MIANVIIASAVIALFALRRVRERRSPPLPPDDRPLAFSKVQRQLITVASLGAAALVFVLWHSDGAPRLSALICILGIMLIGRPRT